MLKKDFIRAAFPGVLRHFISTTTLQGKTPLFLFHTRNTEQKRNSDIKYLYFYEIQIFMHYFPKFCRSQQVFAIKLKICQPLLYVFDVFKNRAEENIFQVSVLRKL